jgi:hypothetical protein
MDKWLGRAVAAVLVASAATAPETGWAVTVLRPPQEPRAPVTEDNGIAARLRHAEAARARWTAWANALLAVEGPEGARGGAPETLPGGPLPEERVSSYEWEHIVPVAMGGSAPQAERRGLELELLLLHYRSDESSGIADVGEGLAREAAAARHQAEKDRAMGGQKTGSGTRQGTWVRRPPLWLIVPVVTAVLLAVVALRALLRQDRTGTTGFGQ